MRPSLWLVPGDIRLSEFESICPTGWTEALAGYARGYRVSGALYRLFRAVASLHNADYVLVDLGPNVSALNRTALVASDGFVVPLAPDLFSIRALPSVGKSIASWVRDWGVAVASKPSSVDFDLPDGHPRPLGYVTQQYTTYSGEPAAAYRDWAAEIPAAYQAGVMAPLAEVRLRTGNSEELQLAKIKNLSSLVPTAQRAHKAIFELSGSEARGSHHTKAQGTRSLFTQLAQQMTRLLNAES